MARRVGFGDAGHDNAVRRRRSVLGRDHRATPEPPRPDWSEERTDRRAKAKRYRGASIVFLLFILLFPLVFGGIGGYMLIDANRFSSVAEKAVGAVVKVETHSGSDGTSYTAIFRYTDAAGRSHTAPTHISSSGYNYRRGETEDILYDPTAPDDEVRVNGVFSLWGLPVIFSAVGLLFLFGLFRAYKAHRRNQSGA
jgi:hypothetical protein